MACCFCCAVGLRRLAAPTFGGRLLLLLCRSAFDGWLLLRLRCIVRPLRVCSCDVLKSEEFIVLANGKGVSTPPLTVPKLIPNRLREGRELQGLIVLRPDNTGAWGAA
jgi:hypothetical protein